MVDVIRKQINYVIEIPPMPADGIREARIKILDEQGGCKAGGYVILRFQAKLGLWVVGCRMARIGIIVDEALDYLKKNYPDGKLKKEK